MNKIKRQISYILFKHLIQPLKHEKLRAIKIPSNDKDEALLSAICEIRRYLYGNLNEEMIANYLSGRSNRIFFKGVMSFYPLINDVKQMKQLDGWLTETIYKSVHKQSKLLLSHSFNVENRLPFSLGKDALVEYCRNTVIHKKKLLKIPSFTRIYKAMAKGLIDNGVVGIIDSQRNSYNYE